LRQLCAREGAKAFDRIPPPLRFPLARRTVPIHIGLEVVSSLWSKANFFHHASPFVIPLALTNSFQVLRIKKIHCLSWIVTGFLSARGFSVPKTSAGGGRGQACSWCGLPRKIRRGNGLIITSLPRGGDEKSAPARKRLTRQLYARRVAMARCVCAQRVPALLSPPKKVVAGYLGLAALIMTKTAARTGSGISDQASINSLQSGPCGRGRILGH
jgi:hypothetical protein